MDNAAAQGIFGALIITGYILQRPHGCTAWEGRTRENRKYD